MTLTMSGKATSALEISGYEVSDNKTLTSEDWEALKNGQQGSHLELKPTAASAKTTNAFSKLKQDSRGGNDDWIYLASGIGLIGAGAAAIGVIIFTTVRAKKKLK